MIIHLKNGKNIAVDYREEAPGKASRNMYLDKNGHADADLSRLGHLSTGIPGTIAGLFMAHRYGRLPFRDLIEPAIQLAEKGFAITAAEARSLNATQAEFKKYNTLMPVFVRAGGWKTGDTLIQKQLANTLSLIRDKGAEGFYDGETAQKIVAEMKKGHGIISLQDLKNYRAKIRTPRIFDYKGATIVTMPLPSSGGLLLEQMLKILSGYPVAGWGFESVKSVQLMTEIERRCYADRAKFLGDADFVKVPVRELVSDAYLRNRMKDYDPHKATPSSTVQAGNLPGEKEETTHISVADKDGNAVSSTYTLNGIYGSKVVVGGAGFFLNDEMDDFSAKPGAPNMFGLVGAEANAIAPRKRMLSSMTPTIVLKNNKPFLVLGTPGGATIITSVFQTITDLLDFNMSVSDAVNKPKFHEQWLPDAVFIEKGFPKTVKDSMETMGYKFVERGAIGRTELIRITNGSIEAVGDHRGDDSVAGY